MFDVMNTAGRQLLEYFGAEVEYRSQSAGVSFVVGVIDKNPFIQDPGSRGGVALQTPKVMGYVCREDVPECQDGDLMIYAGDSYRVKAPRDGEGGLWEFTLTKVAPGDE